MRPYSLGIIKNRTFQCAFAARAQLLESHGATTSLEQHPVRGAERRGTLRTRLSYDGRCEDDVLRMSNDRAHALTIHCTSSFQSTETARNAEGFAGDPC